MAHAFRSIGRIFAIAINWRRAQTRAQISFDDSGVNSNLVSTNKTLTPFLGLPGARWPMRSMSLISVEKCPRKKSCLDVAMTMVMRTKYTFGVDTVLPEHVCQAESGRVISCNLAAGATEVQSTCTVYASGAYQQSSQMVPDTQTAE